MTETLPTSYLPAERASAAELARQAGKLPRTEVSFEALDSLQSFCMVLNRFRRDYLAQQSQCAAVLRADQHFLDSPEPVWP